MPEVVDAVAAEVTVGEDGVAAVEAVVAALSVTTQSDLHRACAEGRLEDVRALLARGLQSLETLGECRCRCSWELAVVSCVRATMGCDHARTVFSPRKKRHENGSERRQRWRVRGSQRRSLVKVETEADID
jgi:hypothetical protein